MWSVLLAKVLVNAALVAAPVGFVARRKLRAPADGSNRTTGGDAGTVGEDPVVGPAFSWLVAWSVAQRRLLWQVARALDLDPGALATIIELESGGDPTQPHEKKGTPRGGLIQVTQGANLPGLKTADAVWAIRSWPVERQLEELVRPFFANVPGRSPAVTAFRLYQWNFLPADVGKPLEHKVGVKGSDELVTPKAQITRGQVYAANHAFDGEGKGFFTWADVKAKVDAAIAKAGGKSVTVSGAVRFEEPAEAPENPGVVPEDKGGSPPPGTQAAEPAGVAPALRALVRQVNDAWPSRARGSDGGLPSAEHLKANPKSDHNTGDAYDFTADTENGPDLEALAALLLKDPRVQYVIWDRRIANRDIEGGRWRAYSGSNPHTRHLHVSLRPARRDDTSPWTLPAGRGPWTHTAAAVVREDLPDVVAAWQRGVIDNVYWKTIHVGPYALRVATDALSVADVRVPVSFGEVIALAKVSNYLPLTRAICDARWAAATRKVVLSPLGVPGSPELLQKYPTVRAQAVEWSKRIGPKAAAGELVAGPWKEWIP